MGGIPMMSGSSAPRSEPSNANMQDKMVMQLNTYIYDYFIKRGYYDCARALVQDDNFPINAGQNKSTPGHRREGEVNGVDGDAMQMDSKDDVKSKIPEDLPRPNLNGGDLQQTSFLFDWFNLFWDVFWAQRKKGKSNDASQYIQQTKVRPSLRPSRRDCVC